MRRDDFHARAHKTAIRPRLCGGALLRRIPRVLGSSFRLVWEAAPGRFLASLAPQAVTAVTTGAQLVITRDLIAAVLATGSGGDLSRVTTLLAEMIGLSR